jgi:hypothetical protein
LDLKSIRDLRFSYTGIFDLIFGWRCFATRKMQRLQKKKKTLFWTSEGSLDAVEAHLQQHMHREEEVLSRWKDEARRNKAPKQTQPQVRDQFWLGPQLQQLVGKTYVDEQQFLSLLLSQGLCKRVETFNIPVRPVGGQVFSITLDAQHGLVSNAKAEIERELGTPIPAQEIYALRKAATFHGVRGTTRVEERLLLLANDDPIKVADNLTLSVKPLVQWKKYSLRINVSIDGLTATKPGGQQNGGNHASDLVMSDGNLTEGRHYWEVQLASKARTNLWIGVSRPNLELKGFYAESDCNKAWLINADDGALYGNGKMGDEAAGRFREGDRVGMLLDLNEGYLLFFKNGVKHGPGYPAGSVFGPVAHAMQMGYDFRDMGGKLLFDAEGRSLVTGRPWA